MARSNTGFVCHAHTTKVSYEIHHVWPQEYHGPNSKSNLVKICCNAHSDIHWLLNLMLKGKPYVLSDYGPHIRTLAQQGYDAIMAYGKSLSDAK